MKPKQNLFPLKNIENILNSRRHTTVKKLEAFHCNDEKFPHIYQIAKSIYTIFDLWNANKNAQCSI